MRVVDLDMTNSSHQCFEGFTTNEQGCTRIEMAPGCSETNLSTFSFHFSEVCGQISGYSLKSPDGFGKHNTDARSPNPTVDDNYVDGISLTVGQHPRKHIWTFAAASGGNTTTCFGCSQNDPPTFVSQDYFCDRSRGIHSGPLWDGAGCKTQNPCCTMNDPPWFYKDLQEPTTADIELRLCRDEGAANEDIALQKVEIYVQ